MGVITVSDIWPGRKLRRDNYPSITYIITKLNTRWFIVMDCENQYDDDEGGYKDNVYADNRKDYINIDEWPRLVCKSKNEIASFLNLEGGFFLK